MNDDWSLKNGGHDMYDWDRHMDNVIRKVYYSEETIETLRQKLIEDLRDLLIPDITVRKITTREIEKIVNKRFGVE